MRQVARRLRPGVLDDLGLVSALDALAADVTEASGVPVTVEVDADLPGLGADAELVVYRIAQESLTNVARHAGAHVAELALRREGAAVVLRVTDDGGGIGSGIGAGVEGAGIRGMRERALLVGAELRVGPRADRRHRGPAPGAAADDDRVNTRILLADDHALVRRGLRLILDGEPGLTVVAEAGDGAEAVERVAAGGVDLAVLDIAMPRMTGLQAAREISRRGLPVRMLMLSMYDNEQYLLAALQAGASGYVLKSVVDRDLVAACRAAVRGEPFLHAGAAGALIRDHLRRGTVPERLLTPREEEVVKLIAEGHSAKEIADTLVISVKTVDRHRANVLAKLGLRDRLDLTRFAIRAGLVEP